jgi:hypothetical protein
MNTIKGLVSAGDDESENRMVKTLLAPEATLSDNLVAKYLHQSPY